MAVCVILFAMPIRSSVVSPAARQTAPVSLPDNAQVRTALEWFAENRAWVDDQQIRLTEIPAPSFEEENRAAVARFRASVGVMFGQMTANADRLALAFSECVLLGDDLRITAQPRRVA